MQTFKCIRCSQVVDIDDLSPTYVDVCRTCEDEEEYGDGYKPEDYYERDNEI